MQYGKSATWKESATQKNQHEESATRRNCNIKMCNIKRVQHEASKETGKTWEKKCKRRVHYKA